MYWMKRKKWTPFDIKWVTSRRPFKRLKMIPKLLSGLWMHGSTSKLTLSRKASASSNQSKSCEMFIKKTPPIGSHYRLEDKDVWIELWPKKEPVDARSADQATRPEQPIEDIIITTTNELKEILSSLSTLPISEQNLQELQRSIATQVAAVSLGILTPYRTRAN